MSDDPRWCRRRRVYLGDGLTFEVRAGGSPLDAGAIDITCGGLGLALLDAPAAPPAAGEAVRVRYTGPGASGGWLEADVRHAGMLRSRGRSLPRLGLALRPQPAETPAFACPAALPAFAAAACPWLCGDVARFAILRVGPHGMTLRATRHSPPLLAHTELDFELHLPLAGVEHARGRVTSVGRAGDGFEAAVAWADPSPTLLSALAQYLLAGDTAPTPAALRAAGLAVGSVARAATYDYATSHADNEEILALRLLAHQAEGHLADLTVADLRSPFDAHSRHVTCRVGGRIVGYVRVIFVDGDPARSQYVALGGHDVPQWLWDAGFVEGGAGAIHPDFQRAGLYGPLMRHMFRVAVQSGHRYILGACPDELVAMYTRMGFEALEERIVTPKPGWSFRSHLLYADALRGFGDAGLRVAA
jgi:hypothetical protein